MPDSLVESLTQNFTLRQMYSLEETHVFSPTLVNTARAGFSRVRATVTQPVSALNPLAKDRVSAYSRAVCAGYQHHGV